MIGAIIHPVLKWNHQSPAIMRWWSEQDKFIKTLQSIHGSVSNIGTASFKSEVCRLINAYLSEHVLWVLEGKASALENMLGFETFLVKLKKKTPMQLIIEMLYHWVHSVTFEGSNFNRLVQVEAINKYGISIDADHSLSKNQNTHSLRLLIRGAKTEKLQL